MLLRYSDYSKELLRRPEAGNDDILSSVKAIIGKVRADGDKALLELAERFDGSAPSSLFVTDDEIDAAASALSPGLRRAIDAARDNIAAFHSAQMPEGETVETAPGVVCSRKIVPIERVGLYSGRCGVLPAYGRGEEGREDPGLQRGGFGELHGSFGR